MGNKKKKATSFVTMVKKNWKKIIMVPPIMAFISTIVATQMKSCTDTNIANQQHQDKQEEIQLKKEEACRFEVKAYYSEYVKMYEDLRDDITYIQDMYSKWFENNRTLPTEDEEKLKNIFNRICFILKSDEGDNLKQKMEIWLKVLVPSIKSDEEEYKKLKEQMDQETAENPSNRVTPLTPALPDLTDAMEAYDTFFKTFMDEKVQECTNKSK